MSAIRVLVGSPPGKEDGTLIANRPPPERRHGRQDFGPIRSGYWQPENFIVAIRVFQL